MKAKPALWIVTVLGVGIGVSGCQLLGGLLRGIPGFGGTAASQRGDDGDGEQNDDDQTPSSQPDDAETNDDAQSNPG